MSRCQHIEVDGQMVRYQGEPTDNPETLEAIRAVIRAATERLAVREEPISGGIKPFCNACGAMIEADACWKLGLTRSDCDYRMLG